MKSHISFWFFIVLFFWFVFSGLGRLPNLHLVGSGEETFANVHKFTNFLETVEDFQKLNGSAAVFKGPTCQISPKKAILKRCKRHSLFSDPRLDLTTACSCDVTRL